MGQSFLVLLLLFLLLRLQVTRRRLLIAIALQTITQVVGILPRAVKMVGDGHKFVTLGTTRQFYVLCSLAVVGYFLCVDYVHFCVRKMSRMYTSSMQRFMINKGNV